MKNSIIAAYSLLLSLIFCFGTLTAQYAPAAGLPGTTAIYQDSLSIGAWAQSAQLHRSWMNIADTTLGLVSFGTTQSALGKADNDVVSLGDGGSIDLFFQSPIMNGPGWDFAVFENSFNGYFLELAFVEVSSDGIHFFRFPSHSLTNDSVQVGGFDSLQTTKINNLAGKYITQYGTPFDLEELKSQVGLNVNHIVSLRIIDVVGSLDTNFCSYDSQGRKINDPWPTPFPSGGFDLDAVGVHDTSVGWTSLSAKEKLRIFPNPCQDFIQIQCNRKDYIHYKLMDLQGKVLMEGQTNEENYKISVQNFHSGVYILQLQNTDFHISKKIVIN